MLAIEFRFLTGRFHATPWGRQVNEGAVEWPPAPWRLLRALLAVWHLKCPDVPEKDLRELIALLSPPPQFRLPPALTAHTRHYMPAEDDKLTKIFDAFVVVDPNDPLIAVWSDVTLSADQQALLSRLLAALQFFGRAESWVEAKIADEFRGPIDAVPLEDEPSLEIEDRELVRLLAADDEELYAAWRTKTRDIHARRKLEDKRQKQLAKGKSVDKIKLTKSENQKIDENLPDTVFDALHADTSQLRSAGWSAPPASRWVDYSRSRHAFAAKPAAGSPARPPRPTIARYAVCGKVRPRLTDALWIGERARTILMGCSRKTRPDDNAASVFSGKQTDGSFREDGHRHAHFLCEAAGKESQITHLNIYAPDGFEEPDRLAFSRFTKVWGHGGNDMTLVLIGVGEPVDFGGTRELAGQSKGLAESKVWVSRTPFVPPRHLKIKRSEQGDPEKRAKAARRELERILRRELRQREAFAAIADEVEIVPLLETFQSGTQLGGTFTSWLKFRRERKDGKGRHAGLNGYGFRLTFPRPVRGPIVLGYGCHFGLGQFVTD